MRFKLLVACLLRAHRMKLLQDDNAMLRDNIKREQQAREDIARLMREECGSMAARLREEVRGGARVRACMHVTLRNRGIEKLLSRRNQSVIYCHKTT